MSVGVWVAVDVWVVNGVEPPIGVVGTTVCVGPGLVSLGWEKTAAGDEGVDVDVEEDAACDTCDLLVYVVVGTTTVGAATGAGGAGSLRAFLTPGILNTATCMRENKLLDDQYTVSAAGKEAVMGMNMTAKILKIVFIIACWPGIDGAAPSAPTSIVAAKRPAVTRDSA